ncbi:hypothetical protein [Pseudomonas sp. MYb118]
MDNAFKQPLFVVGLPLLVIGISTGNTAFWVPGLVFMVIGWTKRSKR